MSNLNDKTKAELAEIASAMDIQGRSSMSKDELAAAIEQAGAEPAEGNYVTPVIPDPPEHPRPVQDQGGGQADQSSQGGTVTGTPFPGGERATPTARFPLPSQ